MKEEYTNEKWFNLINIYFYKVFIKNGISIVIIFIRLSSCLPIIYKLLISKLISN